MLDFFCTQTLLSFVHAGSRGGRARCARAAAHEDLPVSADHNVIIACDMHVKRLGVGDACERETGCSAPCRRRHATALTDALACALVTRGAGGRLGFGFGWIGEGARWDWRPARGVARVLLLRAWEACRRLHSSARCTVIEGGCVHGTDNNRGYNLHVHADRIYACR